MEEAAMIPAASPPISSPPCYEADWRLTGGWSAAGCEYSR